MSTLAYASFRGSKLRLDALGSSLLQPDLTVYVDVPLEVRKARLEARGPTAADRETLSSEASERLLNEHLSRSGLPGVGHWLRLDAAGLKANEVVDAVSGAIMGLAAAASTQGAFLGRLGVRHSA